MRCDKCNTEFTDSSIIRSICGDCYCDDFTDKPVPKMLKPTTAQVPELVGIINRPQFDTGYYSVNSAVHVTELGRKGVEEFNGIVIGTEPHQLFIAWFDEDGDANDNYLIGIDEVINGKIKLRKLM